MATTAAMQLQDSMSEISTFIHAVGRLAEEINQSREEVQRRENQFKESVEQQAKESAIITGISNLSCIQAVDIVDDVKVDGGLKVTVVLDLVSLELQLDAQNKLSGFALHGTEDNILSHVDFDQVLDNAIRLDAPTDIRWVVQYIASAQHAPRELQSHFSKLRNRCIIQPQQSSTSTTTSSSTMIRKASPMRFTLTLRSGVEVLMKAHDCYPNVAGGIMVEAITLCNTALDKAAIYTESFLLELREKANSSLDTEVAAVLDFIESALSDHLNAI